MTERTRVNSYNTMQSRRLNNIDMEIKFSKPLAPLITARTENQYRSLASRKNNTIHF
jgi:hypothetical protein